MPNFNLPNPIYTSPQSDAHLRNILSKLQQIANSTNDDVDAIESLVQPEATFSVATTAGQLLYASGSGSVGLALATTFARSLVIGMAVADVAMGEVGKYQPIGVVDASALTLTPGTQYFLSTSVAGGMTTTAPSSAGQYIVSLGAPTETGKFFLCPAPPILI